MDDARVDQIPLLAVLDKRARSQVLKEARLVRYAAGDTVVSEGDPATRLYIIVSGHAQVTQRELGLVATLNPGEFFGELALIEGHGRTASVVAADDLECLMISAWEFKASLREHPEMAVPMLETIIARIHRREHHGG
jgi:CRP-like cAMP-binding protein